jgi:tripartite-type tricarboxylate transporter receptor subunit TctC
MLIANKLAAFAAVVVFSTTAALAQTWPERQINMIVPFPAGGPTDTVARLVAEKMGADLGQRIIVENVGGAGGTLGARKVATAAPDGYTLLLHNIGMASGATLYRKIAYDTLTAFDYVGLVTEVPMTLVGRKDFEPTDFKSLVEYIKANGDKVTFANAGAASHLCSLMMLKATGKNMTAVPYKGTGPAMTDLLGGQVDLMCDQTTNTTEHIKGATIKAYAATTPQRIKILPDLPTAIESGYAGFDVSVWHGIYSPKGTPSAINERLSASLQKALADPDLVKRFSELGTTPVPAADATPSALKARLEAEVPRWKVMIDAAGIYAD